MTKEPHSSKKPNPAATDPLGDRARAHLAMLDAVEKEIKQTHDRLSSEIERLTRQARKNLTAIEERSAKAKRKSGDDWGERFRQALKNQKKVCKTIESGASDIDGMIDTLNRYHRYLKSLIEIK